MDFDSVIDKRRSSRAFKSKKASWKSVLDAIDTAIKGPFADNRCNLKFLIVEDTGTIGKIAHHCEQSWISDASIIIVVCSDDTNLENMHHERGRIYARQQAGAAIENLLLKLTDLGLGSCWVGSFKDEMVKQLLKIPSHIQIEAIVPVGYPSSKGEKKYKTDLENVLYWELWGTKKKPALIKESYDELSLAR
jgi:nitroreductase